MNNIVFFTKNFCRLLIFLYNKNFYVLRLLLLLLLQWLLFIIYIFIIFLIIMKCYPIWLNITYFTIHRLGSLRFIFYFRVQLKYFIQIIIFIIILYIYHMCWCLLKLLLLLLFESVEIVLIFKNFYR